MTHTLIIILLLVQGIVHSTESNPDQWKKYTNQIISRTLERHHYVDQPINDNFSKRVFELFINQIDPNKNFFTARQLIELNAYEYKIDNDIRQNSFYFYDLCLLRLNEQIELSHAIFNTIIKDAIDLELALKLETNLDKKKYVTDNAALTNRWKVNVHYQVAQRYISLYKEKYPSRNHLVIEKELALEARLKTKKDIDRRFKRLFEKKDRDYFTEYLDAITQAFGPHTSYLPPEEKEDFDINMSGKLEGIGAVLRESDGVIKVVRIIPGSASWRQGELQSEDTILSVAQAKKDPVSIIETPVRDAVKLIRGPKGSTVNLTIKKPSGIIKTIAIKRDIVVIKSAYAKYGFFNTNNDDFGYIYLPSFYRDFDNQNNQNAANDIKKALTALQNTRGLILDLRNNGGGSLQDAVDIAGYFIPSGPVVQVSDSAKQKRIYTDIDDQVIYNKPLVVLVNRFSASASEIVAAALQDYNRAIILGNSQTFGKGTVQKVVNLDGMLLRKQSPLGFIKITIQEYFRINGLSTQFKGVVPDIIYPSQFDYLDVGEKELKFAFKGSTTSPASYERWSPQKNNQVIDQSYERLKKNPSVMVLHDYNRFMELQRDQSNKSTNIQDLWTGLNQIKQKTEELNNKKVIKTFLSYKSVEPRKAVSDKTKKNDELSTWVTNFDNDMLLNEAINVLIDLTDNPATSSVTALTTKT